MQSGLPCPRKMCPLREEYSWGELISLFCFMYKNHWYVLSWFWIFCFSLSSFILFYTISMFFWSSHNSSTCHKRVSQKFLVLFYLSWADVFRTKGRFYIMVGWAIESISLFFLFWKVLGPWNATKAVEMFATAKCKPLDGQEVRLQGVKMHVFQNIPVALNWLTKILRSFFAGTAISFFQYITARGTWNELVLNVFEVILEAC